MARCSVTDLLLPVTTVFSGSETRRAILSLGFRWIHSQDVLVSHKNSASDSVLRVKCLRVYTTLQKSVSCGIPKPA